MSIKAKRFNLDLVAVQETWATGDRDRPLGDYTYNYGGANQHILGTGFLVNKRIEHTGKKYKFVNNRLSYIVIEGRWYKNIFINVHCPSEDKKDDVKDAYYETLEELIDKFPPRYSIVILGDLNAKIEKEQAYRRSIGSKSLDDVSNKNGFRVVSLTWEINFIVKSTCFKHKT